jgi:hypothetical protein
MTLPGIITSEIALALAQSTSVTRIDVDLGAHSTVGLHRAPSLAAAHGAGRGTHLIHHSAPKNARLRAKAFREWIGPDVKTAIAYAWPGIDNGWIRQYLQAAKSAGASTTVVCASLPTVSHASIAALAATMAQADLVLVGDSSAASDLVSAFGPSGPVVETHRALSLGGRESRPLVRQITAFITQNDIGTLSTLLAAFDAIPEAWIDGYCLQVVVRHAGQVMSGLVADSHHSDHVQLVGGEISAPDLELLCKTSSALCVVDPAFDSRAFLAAVDSGIATVILAGSILPEAGGGYVGGFLADLNRPASVHVALAHALRISELGFPHPDAWDELAERISGATHHQAISPRFLEPAIRAG